MVSSTIRMKTAGIRLAAVTAPESVTLRRVPCQLQRCALQQQALGLPSSTSSSLARDIWRPRKAPSVACSATQTRKDDQVRAAPDAAPGDKSEGASPAPGQQQQRHDAHGGQEESRAAAGLEEKAAEAISGVVEEDGGISSGAAVGGSVAAVGILLASLVGLGALGYVYRDNINEYLLVFEEFIKGNGPVGYVIFILGYAGLEVLAIPALPLTMSAGLLFGTLYGTLLVSTSGVLAATGAFLIARYVARDKIMALAKGNKKFEAIDRAIGKNSFKVVTLLRLSPLLPFSLGNYIYGLTSVKLLPYVLGSWIGMLPGTWAYVSAGSLSRTLLQDEGSLPHGTQLWTLGLGVAATVGAAVYVTRIAQEAVKEIDEPDK